MSRFYSGPYVAAWRKPNVLNNKDFVCGYCGNQVSSISGYQFGQSTDGSGQEIAAIYICSSCKGPNVIGPGAERYPSPAFGMPVRQVPDSLNQLYEEARRCTQERCFTAAVLICRKMLMNVAVEQGGNPGGTFQSYVTYLGDQGYVPPNGRHWLDHIRKKGNEATHEIQLMSEADARDLLIFVEMLLRFIYEFPSMVGPFQV
jgi:DNA-directed RNA polymerase subunit RPC12/RpoP